MADKAMHIIRINELINKVIRDTIVKKNRELGLPPISAVEYANIYINDHYYIDEKLRSLYIEYKDQMQNLTYDIAKNEIMTLVLKIDNTIIYSHAKILIKTGIDNLNEINVLPLIQQFEQFCICSDIINAKFNYIERDRIQMHIYCTDAINTHLSVVNLLKKLLTQFSTITIYGATVKARPCSKIVYYTIAD